MGTTSGTERALIAVGIGEHAVIMATDGLFIIGEMELLGPYGDSVEEVFGDIFAQGVLPGLYLWEGVGEWRCDDTPDCPGEPYIDWKGAVRPVTHDELPTLLAMRPPEEGEVQL